jgi:branched-chain amino acid transport system permease protein
MPERASAGWFGRASARRWLLAAGLAAFLLVPLLAWALDEPFWLDLVSRIMIFGLVALSLDLILGFGGMVSFGHAAYFGIGAYVVGILAHHASEDVPLVTWPVEIGGSEAAYVAWPAAVFAAALAALLIGLVSLRTRGVYFIMITLAFAQMVYFFFVSLETYGGDDGLILWSRSGFGGALDIKNDTVFYYLVLAILLVVLFLGRRLVASRFGMVIRGIRENERRMRALGYPVFRYKLACFVIAGAVAGLAGALMANQTEFVSPSFLHWTRSGEILIMVIMGGMGSLFGPVIGAAALLLLEEVLSGFTQHWQIILGPLLIAVVLFARRGLYGLVDGRRDGGG